MVDEGAKMWSVTDPQGNLRGHENTEDGAKVAFLRSTGENATLANVSRIWPEWEHLGYRCKPVGEIE